MNALTHWNRFKQLAAMREGRARLFSRSPLGTSSEPETMPLPAWGSLTGISNDDHKYLVSPHISQVSSANMKVNNEFRGGKRTHEHHR